MPFKDPSFPLSDIQEAIAKIQDFTAGMDFEEFRQDPKTVAAVERKLPIDELLAQISSGACRELFACGTAAIVCPISAVGDADGRDYPLAVVDEQARALREQLLAIQERRAPDPYGWTTDVPVLSKAG